MISKAIEVIKDNEAIIILAVMVASLLIGAGVVGRNMAGIDFQGR